MQSSRIELPFGLAVRDHSKAVLLAVMHLLLPRAKKVVACLDKENWGGDDWRSAPANQEDSMELPFLCVSKGAHG